MYVVRIDYGGGVVGYQARVLGAGPGMTRYFAAALHGGEEAAEEKAFMALEKLGRQWKGFKRMARKPKLIDPPSSPMVRALRQHFEMNQMQFSRLFYATQSGLSRYESGRRMPMADWSVLLIRVGMAAFDEEGDLRRTEHDAWKILDRVARHE